MVKEVTQGIMEKKRKLPDHNRGHIRITRGEKPKLMLMPCLPFCAFLTDLLPPRFGNLKASLPSVVPYTKCLSPGNSPPFCGSAHLHPFLRTVGQFSFGTLLAVWKVPTRRCSTGTYKSVYKLVIKGVCVVRGNIISSKVRGFVNPTSDVLVEVFSFRFSGVYQILWVLWEPTTMGLPARLCHVMSFLFWGLKQGSLTKCFPVSTQNGTQCLNPTTLKP